MDAPILFISYSHDTAQHRERVLSLSERLRDDGFETRLDQYVNGSPGEGWPRWMLDRLDEAAYVLCVCTEIYYRRFRGHEELGKGKGVDWEGAIITQQIYDARSQTKKFVPILFDDGDRSFVPDPLRGQTLYTLNYQASYQTLCDFLDDAHGVEPRPVGKRVPRQRRKGTALSFPDRPQDASQSESTFREAEATSSKIVPQGLQSFTDVDAEFYPSLLPPPFRDGLPESIGVWKRAFETKDKSCRVGILYGPSGCGKSSLVRAGLIPRLAEHVTSVYLAADATSTESRLRTLLAAASGKEAAEQDLSGLLNRIKDFDRERGHKRLLVIDQFEQWLHAHRRDSDPELVRALRSCDGESLQALLLVRTEFWLPISRFIEAFDVQLKDEVMTRLFDRFDKQHAKKVLLEFGRGYDTLPADPRDLTDGQRQFLDDAVDLLEEDDGSVVPLRISLFALLMKGRNWEPSQLEPGFKTLGVTFLRQHFDPPNGQPLLLGHRQGVIAMLKTMLPPIGIDITGAMQSKKALKSAFGSHFPDKKFDSVLGILNHELRVISPAVSSTELADHGTGGAEASTDECYKLTHDFLVPSLREWLAEGLKRAWHGRAIARLQELTESWSHEQNDLFLPNWFDHPRIRLAIRWRRHALTHGEAALLTAALKRHGLQLSIFCAVALLAGIVGINVWGTSKAVSLLRNLQVVSANSVVSNAPEFESYRYWVRPRLSSLTHWQSHLAQLSLDADKTTHVALLLEFLLSPACTWVDFVVIQRALAGNLDRARLDALWNNFHDREEDASDDSPLTLAAFRAGIVLAAYDASSSNWKSEDCAFLAVKLVQVSPDDATTVRQLLEPISGRLQPTFRFLVVDQKLKLKGLTLPESLPGFWRQMAAHAIVDYFSDDKELLCDCACGTTESRFKILLKLQGATTDWHAELVPDLKKVVAHPAQSKYEHATYPEIASDPEGDEDRRVRLGTKRAIAALALIRLEQPLTPLQDLLVLEVDDDPEAQSQFIRSCQRFDVSTDKIWELYRQLFGGSDVNDSRQWTLQARALNDTRYALLLCLGRHGKLASASDMTTALAHVKALYQKHPSSAIHGAAKWLLIQWFKRDPSREAAHEEIASIEGEIMELDRQIAAEAASAPKREWFLRKDGRGFVRTFVRFEGGACKIGTPRSTKRWQEEWNREPQDEMIESPFAICTQEVTRAEFEAYQTAMQHSGDLFHLNKDFTDPKQTRLYPYGHNPMGHVRWFDAVRFCRWLTEHEDEQCYDELVEGNFTRTLRKIDGKFDIVDGRVVQAERQLIDTVKAWELRKDHAVRRGFRLPLEKEWEYACRSGTMTSFGFGSDYGLTTDYGWYLDNREENLIGKWGCQKFPNLQGLFDMHGNMLEWCQDYGFSPEGAEGDKSRRVIRGGGWEEPSHKCRSGWRYKYIPHTLHSGFGFRIVCGTD